MIPVPPSPPAIEMQLPPAACIGSVLFPVAVPPVHNRDFWILHGGVKVICQGPVDKVIVAISLQVKTKSGWLPESDRVFVKDPPLPGKTYRVTDNAVCSRSVIRRDKRRSWRLAYRITIKANGRGATQKAYSDVYLVRC